MRIKVQRHCEDIIGRAKAICALENTQASVFLPLRGNVGYISSVARFYAGDWMTRSQAACCYDNRPYCLTSDSLAIVAHSISSCFRDIGLYWGHDLTFQGHVTSPVTWPFDSHLCHFLLEVFWTWSQASTMANVTRWLTWP